MIIVTEWTVWQRRAATRQSIRLRRNCPRSHGAVDKLTCPTTRVPRTIGGSQVFCSRLGSRFLFTVICESPSETLTEKKESEEYDEGRANDRGSGGSLAETVLVFEVIDEKFKRSRSDPKTLGGKKQSRFFNMRVLKSAESLLFFSCTGDRRAAVAGLELTPRSGRIVLPAALYDSVRREMFADANDASNFCRRATPAEMKKRMRRMRAALRPAVNPEGRCALPAWHRTARQQIVSNAALTRRDWVVRRRERRPRSEPQVTSVGTAFLTFYFAECLVAVWSLTCEVSG
ncbi:hypothetical protein Q8A73_022118 [Channa argus]|nr:hypothetical protein Q8A73_022118 [Channa argus]